MDASFTVQETNLSETAQTSSLRPSEIFEKDVVDFLVHNFGKYCVSAKIPPKVYPLVLLLILGSFFGNRVLSKMPSDPSWADLGYKLGL